MSLIAGILGISSVHDPDHKTVMVTVNSRDNIIACFLLSFLSIFLVHFLLL